MTVSRWIDRTEGDIRDLYEDHQLQARDDAPARGGDGDGTVAARASPTDGTTGLDNLLLARERIYREAHQEFTEVIQPSLRRGGYEYLGREPLNNATLLSRSLYFHRLPDFDALLHSSGGDFRALMLWIRDEAPRRADPFAILNHGEPSG